LVVFSEYSSNKAYCDEMAKILLNVALNTINQTSR
jgi:hypothetical protein